MLDPRKEDAMLAQSQHPSTTVGADRLEYALRLVGADRLGSKHSKDLDPHLVTDSVSMSLITQKRLDGELMRTAPLCVGLPNMILGGSEAYLLFEFARFVASTARDRGVSDTILFRMVDTEPVFSWGIYALIPSQHGFNMPGGGE